MVLFVVQLALVAPILTLPLTHVKLAIVVVLLAATLATLLAPLVVAALI